MPPTSGPHERYRYRLELARKHFRNAGRLLDVGCGDGGWARWISDALPELEPHGIDVIDACTHDIAFSRYDGHRLPYPDGHFRALVVFSVLHHAAAPAELIAEISRVCCAGGKVLVVEDIASSRIQTWLTSASDLFENRARSFWHALVGARRWAHTHVPMTYAYKSYPTWISMFARHDLDVVELVSKPKFTIEHGIFVLEKRGEQSTSPM